MGRVDPGRAAVLILAGDQDPVANYGEGAYHVANALWASGRRDVRTRVFPGVRHEVHNEPETRAETGDEIVAFVAAYITPRSSRPSRSGTTESAGRQV